MSRHWRNRTTSPFEPPRITTFWLFECDHDWIGPDWPPLGHSVLARQPRLARHTETAAFAVVTIWAATVLFGASCAPRRAVPMLVPNGGSAVSLGHTILC